MTSSSTIINPYGLWPEELEIIRPRTVPHIRDWAEGKIVLPTIESDLTGPFSFDYSPFLRELCDWLEDPFVRELTVMAALQVGKTTLSSLWMYWVSEFAPGNMIVAMTDEVTLQRRMLRLQATFRANPWLMAKIENDIHNLHIGTATQFPDMLLYLAWSNSDATQASDPIPYVIADEVALWKNPTALNNLRGRQTTFRSRSKMLKISSPKYKGDLFDVEFEAGDKCEYWVPCPKCSFWHVMKWHDSEQPEVYVVLDKDKKTKDWLDLRAYESDRHARYRCPSCSAVWSDYMRASVIQEGRWLPAEVSMGRAGKIEGEIEPSAYKSARITGLMANPRLRSLNSMAVSWVKGMLAKRTGDTEPLRHFQNNEMGHSWEDKQAKTDAARLRKHIGTYTSEDIRVGGAVPWGVQAIVIAIDVHDAWFRVVIEGYGYLFESWLIEAMRIETTDTREAGAYECLVPWLVKSWPFANGLSYPPTAVTIDTGYRPEPVKDFCRANRALVFNNWILPVRGSPGRVNQMYRKFKVDATMDVYELNPTAYKDRVWRVLFEATEPGRGYKHLPKDIPGDVVGELCSEHKLTINGKPLWVPKKDGRDNHTWDGCYYNLFAADFAGVGNLKPLPAESIQVVKGPAKGKTYRDDAQGRGGFLDGLPSLNG